MRKITAILCGTLLLLSLTACGRDVDPADTATADTATAATDGTTTTAETAIKAPLNLTYASSFSDGIAFVRYTADGTEKAAAINTAGDVLFDLPEGMENSHYKNGICLVGDLVYDKSGTVIASPETHGYDSLMTENCGGYVLAKKVAPVTQPAPAPAPEAATTTTAAASTTAAATMADESTTDMTAAPTTPSVDIPVTNSVTLSVGVLHNKGEWEQPLSPDHPIAVAMTTAAQPAENFTYVTTDVLQVYVDTAAEPQYYHFSTNALTPNYDHYESINYQDEDTGIYQVAADGSKKLVIKDVVSDYSFKDVFVGRTTVLPAEDAGEQEPQTLIKLYDYTGKALADLTDYPTDGKYFFIADRLLIQTDDGMGNRKLVLLSKDGKEIIEAVPLNLRDTVYAPDEAGFVIAGYTAEGAVSYRHYDYIGNATDYTDVASFNGFSEGLAAVTLTDGTVCYINHMAEIVIR